MYAQDIFRYIWETRDRIRAVWPTPTPEHSFWFADTEGGESVLDMTALVFTTMEFQKGANYSMAYTHATLALDASLRENDYARNRPDKVLSVQEEIADAAMMLGTGLGPQWNEWWQSLVKDQFPLRYYLDLTALSFHCATSAMLAHNGSRTGGRVHVLWIPDSAYYRTAAEAVHLSEPDAAATEGLRIAAQLVGPAQLAELVRKRLARIENKAMVKLQKLQGEPK